MIFTISYNQKMNMITVTAQKVAGEQVESATATFSIMELEAMRLHLRRPVVETHLRHHIPWPVPQRFINAVLALVE